MPTRCSRTTRLAAAAGVLAAAMLATSATAQTPITYQGSLSENGSPVTGPVSVEFRLFDAATGGSQVGPTITRTITPTDGLFTESLDFGTGAFTSFSNPRWLQITVEGTLLGARQPITAAPFALNARSINTNANGVASIGTRFPYPTSKLTISDGDLLGSANANSPLVIVDGNGNAFVNVLSPFETGMLFGDSASSAAGGVVYNNANDAMQFRTGGNQVRMVITANGSVGVGTSTPDSRLALGNIGGTDGARMLGFGEGPNSAFYFESLFAGSDGNNGVSFSTTIGGRGSIMTWMGDGKVGIGTPTPSTALDVNGAVTIRGGADIVEGFDSICNTAFEPGTVLVIDPNNPGKLMCAEGAYDKKVAGVVSGANGVNPGIKLGQSGLLDGPIPVAMTGRVYVKASAENGPIEPGDLLTTAETPGHAMRAADADRSHGAVIGKAMSSLDTGTGLVLVLVNLQ